MAGNAEISGFNSTVRRRRSRTRRFSLGLLLLAICCAFASAARASIIVQQVEAPDPDNASGYAPVDFNGNSTATSVSFPGVTFNAQGSTATSTLSNHAVAVAQGFYGTSPSQPYVTTVYDDTASGFLGSLHVNGGATLPDGFGNSIVVSNHSYVAGYASLADDADAVLRLDYIINNENVTFVAAAVHDTGTFANSYLPWSAYDGLSVSGDSAGTPFAPGASAPGKQHADVWSTSEASFATGRVSGYATALIGQGASTNTLVRSLLMTGADPAAVNSTLGSWTNNGQGNNLSTALGAGKADYNESLAILHAGAQTFQTVSGSSPNLTSPNVSTTSTKGYAIGESTMSRQVIVIYAPLGLSEVRATLNWNVQPTAANIDTGEDFPDITFELRPATLVDGHFAIGDSTGLTGLTSDALSDNVQHLYYNAALDSNGDLAPGYYAFLINGDSDETAALGMSYDVTAAVPEPVSAGWLIAAGLLLRRRRR